MLELTEKRIISLLWILKNKNKAWSINELNKGASQMLDVKNNNSDSVTNLTYKPTHSFVKELEKNGFVSKDPKTNEYHVSRATDLIKLISLARSFQSLKTINFYSRLEFSKKLDLIKDAKLSYSFTLFAGSEFYRQYVKTEQVHVYIKESEESQWTNYLASKNCLKAEKRDANIFLIPTNNEAMFKQAQKIKKFSVAPIPILLSDLLSFGSLGEEQGNFLMDQWISNKL